MTVTVTPRSAVSSPSVRPGARRHLYWLLLALILAAQTGLSVHIIHGTVASPDEARYITAGHQLIYELWNGGGSPYYETFFSGAPDLYCPLAAMADSIGGLTAVRLMSLVFMLSATVMLYMTTKQLFNSKAGIAAAGLFAGVGLTQDLGVYANYDALALLFLACAAYCAARSQESRWLLLVPVTLLAANIAKYMTIIFDPIVIGIAALQLTDLGWRRTAQRLTALGAALGSVLILAVYIAGSGYISGIMFTTIARPSGTNVVLAAHYQSVPFIATESARWIGAIVVLGSCSVLIAGRNRTRVLVLLLLIFAGCLVTMEAFRLHSDESMRQHDDLGVWFTCIAAGYTLSTISERFRWRSVRGAAVVASSLVIVGLGAYDSIQAIVTYEGKQAIAVRNTMDFASTIRPYLSLPGGRYEIGGVVDYQIVYMDRVNIPWFRFYDDIYLKYPIPGHGGDSHGQTHGQVCFKIGPGCMYLEGPAAYSAAIHAHYFALVSMVGSHHGTSQDRAIEQAAEHTPGYVLLTGVGGAPTWIYAPAYAHQ